VIGAGAWIGAGRDWAGVVVERSARFIPAVLYPGTSLGIAWCARWSGLGERRVWLCEGRKDWRYEKFPQMGHCAWDDVEIGANTT